MVDFVDTIVDNLRVRVSLFFLACLNIDYQGHLTPKSKKAPRCKAVTKKGKPCTNPAQPNGYCRLPRHRELARSQQEDLAATTENPTPGLHIADQPQSSTITESPQEATQSPTPGQDIPDQPQSNTISESPQEDPATTTEHPTPEQ